MTPGQGLMYALCVLINCRGCETPFEATKGRGRPRVWCDSCKLIPQSKRYPVTERAVQKACLRCGAAIELGTNKTYCSSSCRNAPGLLDGDSDIPCSNACGKVLTRLQAYHADIYQKSNPNASGWFCSRSCAYDYVRLPPGVKAERERARTNAKNRRRRAQMLGAESERYTTAEIAERDKFVCGICREPVDMALSGLNPWGPTIDHVYPLIRGGSDTLDNVQLAHRTCNLRKHDRVMT